MKPDDLLKNIDKNIDMLPGDLFGVKSAYLYTVTRLAGHDVESAFIALGKAAEKLAGGFLDLYRVTYYENNSIDSLLKPLSLVSPSPSLALEIRNVLKYKNLALGNTGKELTLHELDAAVSSFCAAYQSVCNIIHHRRADSDIAPGSCEGEQR